MQIQFWQIQVSRHKLARNLQILAGSSSAVLISQIFPPFPNSPVTNFPNYAANIWAPQSEAWILQFIIFLPTVGLFLSNISKDICPHPPQWSLHRCNNGGSYDIWVKACQKLSSVKYFVQAAYFCENSLKLEILLNKRSIDHPQLMYSYCKNYTILAFSFMVTRLVHSPQKPYADFFIVFSFSNTWGL